MKTKCYPVYDFDELTQDVQDDAIEKLRDCNVDYDDWDQFVLDDWKEKLELLGYSNIRIFYSGFSSQGDGACFTTADTNVTKWIEAHKCKTQFKALYEYVNGGGYCNVTITTSGRYSHEGTMDVNVELDTWGEDVSDKIQGQAEQLESWMLEDAKELSRKIYKDLEKEYDYRTSREAIKETIDANEWTFDDRGNLDNIIEERIQHEIA